jgi:hypothetical protein
MGPGPRLSAARFKILSTWLSIIVTYHFEPSYHLSAALGFINQLMHCVARYSHAANATASGYIFMKFFFLRIVGTFAVCSTVAVPIEIRPNLIAFQG